MTVITYILRYILLIRFLSMLKVKFLQSISMNSNGISVILLNWKVFHLVIVKCINIVRNTNWLINSNPVLKIGWMTIIWTVSFSFLQIFIWKYMMSYQKRYFTILKENLMLNAESIQYHAIPVKLNIDLPRWYFTAILWRLWIGSKCWWVMNFKSYVERILENVGNIVTNYILIQ